MAAYLGYSKAVVDAALALKSAIGHSHVMADITDLAASLAGKLNDTGDTMTGDLVINNAKLKAGTTTDVLGTALEVIRNNVAVGRIDNNSSGLRVQAQSGTLQLRGTGNNGISIDAAGVADFVSNPTVAGVALAEIIRDTIGSALVQGAGITVTVNDAGDTITIASTAGESMPHVAKSGDYHTVAANYAATNTISLTALLMHTMPIYLPAGSLDQAIIQVKTAGTAGATLRLGLYQGDTLIGDFGTVAGDSTGVKTASASVTVPSNGYYNAVVVPQGVTTTAVVVLRADCVWIASVARGNDMEFSPSLGMTLSGNESGALPSSISAKTRTSINHGPAIRFRRA